MHRFVTLVDPNGKYFFINLQNISYFVAHGAGQQTTIHLVGMERGQSPLTVLGSPDEIQTEIINTAWGPSA
jgi:hypothetical protein